MMSSGNSSVAEGRALIVSLDLIEGLRATYYVPSFPPAAFASAKYLYVCGVLDLVPQKS